jgi:hypothetical protein
MPDPDRTASLMTPAKLAQIRPKAPATPAAWLDQMAADAGYAHVRRLLQLRDDLQDDERRRDFQSLGGDLERVSQALPQLDFGLLQRRGWLARVTGKRSDAGTQFADRFEQADDAVRVLADHAQALADKHQQEAGTMERALLEFEVEVRAIEKIIDQGARWLQDMRDQLKAREVDNADDARRQQAERDAARCETLVERLKVLRAASSAAQQAHVQARVTAARRGALLEMLQHAAAADVRQWRGKMLALVGSGEEGEASAARLDAPMEAHRDLQLCVKQAVADYAQLDAHERTLTEQLEGAAAQLEAAC